MSISVSPDNRQKKTMKGKVYTTAPLPFMGQKRRFLKEFRKALDNYPGNATYVDLFGGSGLLSHTVKAHYPDATVVYNDYDNYSGRLQNVDKVNKLLADLRGLLKEWPADKKITGHIREQVMECVLQAEEQGFNDYITLSSSLLFSMQYVQSYKELEQATLYNKVRQSDYVAAGYLDGLQVVCEDYKALFEKYRHVPGVVFLVDPPYLSTEVGTYKNYWKLKDYLDVLQVLEGTKYFYFTSNKSQIVELCEWISTKTAFNPFQDATQSTTQNTMNHTASYTDIMLYKYVEQ